MSANVSSLLYIRQHDHCPGCRWRTPYNCWPQSLGNPHGHSIHTLEEKTKDQNCRASISSTVFTELSILWSGRNCFLLPLIKSSQTVLTQRIMQKNQNVSDKSQDLRSHLMAALSSSRLRHTSQNLRLKMEGVEKQWATGFLIRVVAMLEQADTTNFRHRSWTTKLQTVQKKRRILTDAIECISFSYIYIH